MPCALCPMPIMSYHSFSPSQLLTFLSSWLVPHPASSPTIAIFVRLVEDSPIYCSTLLPLLYKEIVTQTQAVMEESVNDEHRILRMRARPKILVAENYE